MPAKKQITEDMILSAAFEMFKTGGMNCVKNFQQWQLILL